MKTIQSLEKFIFNLNVNCESLDDKESFYDFCISSCINNDFIEEDTFFEKFKSTKNILNRQCTDKDIKKYFSRYGEYITLLGYMVRNWFLKVEQEN